MTDLIPERHEDDSYGACVFCREWVPHTDDEMVLVSWPCAVERLRRLTEARASLEAGAVGAMENMRDFIRNGKTSLTDEDVANLKALLELDLSLIGKALAEALARTYEETP